MFEAINNNVILKKVDIESHNGILMPDVTQEKAVIMEVVESDCDKVKKGDKVIVKKFDVLPLNYENEEYFIVNCNLIYSKIVNNKIENIKEKTVYDPTKITPSKKNLLLD